MTDAKKTPKILDLQWLNACALTFACFCQVEVLPAGGETSLFKQFFDNWLDKDETDGSSAPYVLHQIAKVEQIPFDASKLHEDPVMAAHHCMPDDGSGKVQVSSPNMLRSFCRFTFAHVSV